MVVKSQDVAAKMRRAPKSKRCWFNRGDGPPDEGWLLFELP
jgi:hypothetical protein